MIDFYALDFNMCRSEEVIRFFDAQWGSVYMHACTYYYDIELYYDNV